jgi:malonate transporter and related proteins
MMIHVLLNALVPIFAVMALGYFAGWIRDVDNHHVAELNALVMDFALPASLFAATASTSGAVLSEQWPLVVFTVSMLALYALSYWMKRHLFGLERGEAAVQAITIALPNYAAAGLPLIAAVFGPAGTIYVALSIATGSIVLSPLTLATLETNKASAGGKDSAALPQAIGRSLCKPIVLGPVLGIAFSLVGIPLPGAVHRSFELIGESAGGVGLFLTGLILSAQRIELSTNMLSGTFLKNVVHPLLAAGLILMLPMDRDTARAVLLLCALPSGFLGILFGLRYGLESHMAGSTLIASSLASAATVAIALVLTAGW